MTTIAPQDENPPQDFIVYDEPRPMPDDYAVNFVIAADCSRIRADTTIDGKVFTLAWLVSVEDHANLAKKIRRMSQAVWDTHELARIAKEGGNIHPAAREKMVEIGLV